MRCQISENGSFDQVLKDGSLRPIPKTIPKKWISWGVCTRQTTLRHPDGTREPSETWEYYFTLRMPRKRRLYCINTEDYVVGYSRWILRFRPGWTIDETKSLDIRPSEASLNQG